MSKCENCRNLFFMRYKMQSEVRVKCLVNPNAFDDLRVGNWSEDDYPDVTYCTHYENKDDDKQN